MIVVYRFVVCKFVNVWNLYTIKTDVLFCLFQLLCFVWKHTLTPKCPSLLKSIFPIKNEHRLIVIPNEVKLIFFQNLNA